MSFHIMIDVVCDTCGRISDESYTTRKWALQQMRTEGWVSEGSRHYCYDCMMNQSSQQIGASK